MTADPSLRSLRHMPEHALDELAADRRVHASPCPGPGASLEIYDLDTGQRRLVRWLRGDLEDDSGWQPQLSPGQAAARQLDRWLSLFAWDANRSRRAALVGETAQNYHNILRGVRSCSLRKIEGWVSAWNEAELGPALALRRRRVELLQ